MSQPRSSPARFLGAALACIALGAAPAAGQGISYSLTPSASSIQWDDALGLRNKALYGGSLALEFDNWLALQGYFSTNNGVQTAAERLGVSDDVAGRLGDQRLRVRSYGANLQAMFPTGVVTPYLTAGGGILDFRPDRGDRSKQLALNLGGGVRMALGGPISLDVFAHDAIFRLNRFALFAPTDESPTATDPDASTVRHNLVIGAGIGIPFGPGRSNSVAVRRPPFGVNGLSFSLEPMAGRLLFDSPDFADQDLAGLRAGVDFGRLVGVRGFYWRGVGDNFTNTDPVQSWGGEAQLRLNPNATGINPFLLLGAAQLDFTSDFRNDAGNAARDKTSLILGGGLSLPLTERFAAVLTARDYVFSTTSALETAQQPNDLTHNWLLGGGLRVSLGGHEGSDAAEADYVRRLRMERQLERERSMRDSLQRELAGTQRSAPRGEQSARDERPNRDARADRMAEDRERDAARAENERRDREARMEDTTRERATGTSRPAGSYVGDRNVVIPVPTEGELYVRYGRNGESTSVPTARTARPAEPVTAARGLPEYELRDIVREAIREEMRDSREIRDERNAYRPREPMPTPRRQMRQSGGEVEPARPAEPSRADTSMMALRNELRSLVDSMRAEMHEARRTDNRYTAAETRGEDSLSEQRIMTHIDSLIEARLRERSAREQEAQDHQPDSQPIELRVEHMPRSQQQNEEVQQMQQVPARPETRYPTFTYSGLTVNQAVQGLLGLRVDLGSFNQRFQGVHFMPELALGWGQNARSTMAVGNVQVQLPSLQLSNWPRLTPHVLAGAGLLHFSDPVGDREGTDGVLNLGYGAALDLWRGGTWFGSPSLVVEHEGVDLFSLNRLLVGLGWTF